LEGFAFGEDVVHVVHLRFGRRSRLDTNHSARPLNGRWCNPGTGEWSKPFEVTPAPVTSLSCPDDNDWAPHLKVKP